MLYDNALLLPLLARAYRATGETVFRQRTEETVHWMLTDLKAGGRAFASARDADSEGEEGAYYTWSHAEINRLLDEDSARLFAEAYDVTPAGNWEGRTILHRLAREESGHVFGLEAEQRLAAARARLLDARAGRPAPLKDDKLLADWNGLAIRGLALAGCRLERPDWIAAAEDAFDFVTAEMADTMRGPGRLLHGHRAGRARHVGTLDDYVFMAWGGLALHRATGARAPLDRARDWMATLDAHFWDDRPFEDGGGAYFQTADDAEALITRTKSAGDSATPAGNAIAAQVHAALYLLTGEAHHAERADLIIRRFAGEVATTPAAYPSLIAAALHRAGGLQLAIVGPPGDPATKALIDTARREAPESLVLQAIDPAEDLPPDHPAAGKGLVAGAPAAYPCRGPVCERPITDPAALAERLREGAPAP